MANLDFTTRILSEGLARAIDRRTFLKRASQMTFGTLLALAVGHGLPSRAAADKEGGVTPVGGPQCAPPGPYCNIGGGPLSGCHGGHCFQHRYNNQVLQCRIIYNWYQTGCWTTPTQGGYWTCCDCGCGTPQVTMCGCAQFSTNPIPLPDAPGGKASH